MNNRERRCTHYVLVQPGPPVKDLLALLLKEDAFHQADIFVRRLRNHAYIDPEHNRPWSSKHLKECYRMGAEKIGWKDRKFQPRRVKDGDWLLGYDMGTGSFGAMRWVATMKAMLQPDGRLL